MDGIGTPYFFQNFPSLGQSQPVSSHSVQGVLPVRLQMDVSPWHTSQR
jgi:hypothetical protein